MILLGDGEIIPILENLEWVTHSENCKHAFDKLGRVKPKGERNGASKLVAREVCEIRNSKLNNRVLAEIYRTTQRNIRHIKQNRTWKHLL